MTNVIAIVTKKSQNHLIKQGIKNVRELQIHLQEIFEESEHQNSVIVKLYKMLFPDWEKIQNIEGFPEVGKALNEYIFNLFIEFDQKHHPSVFSGCAWINQGFSASENLEPWAISIENCKVIYS